MIRQLCLALLLLTICLPVHAQNDDKALSNAEIEQIRDAAYVPNDRVLLFIKLLDARTKSIQDLFAHPRRPGREQDTHDLLQQFTSISDELDDNLNDYSSRHGDIRKALPKLVDATDRWASAIKSPPDDEAYNILRKLALESIHDMRQEATEMISDQKTWFAAHPPPKQDKNAPIDIPR